MNDIKNLAVDLRRIAYWIYYRQDELANTMLGKINKMYKDVSPKIGCYENIWSEIKKMEKLEGGRYKAAERALTASVILFCNS